VPDIVVNVLFVAGRVLLAMAFAFSAFKYGFGGIGMTWADSYRSPFPRLLRRLSALVMVVAAVLVALGAWADIAALVLAVLMLWVTYRMHPYRNEHDPQARMGQQVHFLKNLGLVGGALVLFYAYNELGDDIAWSLTDPLL
jgi:putative oxidoreductase